MLIKKLLNSFLPARLLSELYVEVKISVTTVCNRMLFARRQTLAQSKKLRDLKVELGCSRFKKGGWYGIDLDAETADLRWDIRRGLPFADNSCRFIFSEHVFEHLDLNELGRLLKDCYRALLPGGAIRIVTPDLGRFIRAYIEKDAGFVDAVWTPNDATPTELLNGVFYSIGHRFIHDFDSLQKELLKAGFSKIYHSSYRGSKFSELNIDSDMKHRRIESLYIEAVK